MITEQDIKDYRSWMAGEDWVPPSAAPVPKPPVADHLVCMICGAHYQHGWTVRHYAALHPEAEKLVPEEEYDDFIDGHPHTECAARGCMT